MSRRMRFLLAIFPLCLSLTVTGCGLQDLLGNKKKPATKTTQEQKPVIAVMLDEEDPNKALIQKGINDMAKKSNIQIKYLTLSGKEEQQGSDSQQEGKSDQKDSDQGGQENALKGAKVLIYQGGNASDLLQNADKKKVPVLTLGQVTAGIKPVGVVLPNPEKTGQLMAETLVRRIDSGQIVILQDNPNDSGSQELLAGIKLVLSRYPKITPHIIISPQDSESVARQSLIEFIQKNPGKVQGILAQTEKLAEQAYEVIKQKGLDKKIALVSGQANIKSLQRIANGEQIGDVDTSPYLLGVNAYQWAQKLVKKESLDIDDSITSDQGEIPAKVIPVKMVTADNFSVVEKSYSKTITAMEQEKSDNKQNQQKGSSDQGQGQGGDSKSSGGGENKGKTTSGANIPAGVKKVTERVKTEIIREYLDANGKVIGTEKSANEQVKTVPPEMLQQGQQQQDQGKDQKQGDKQGGGQGDGQGGGQGAGQAS